MIAIVGILAAILFPATAATRVAANRAKTRVQLSQWSAGVEAFRQEYGYYPAFAADHKVNGSAANDAGTLHPFHDTLAARRRDGTALPPIDPLATADPPPPELQNARRIPLVLFGDSEIFAGTHGVPSTRNLLHDAFDNTDIAVLVDRNLDGRIDGSDIAELPAVSPPDNALLSLRPSLGDFPATGVRAGVVFYCAPPKAVDESQLILSWK